MITLRTSTFRGIEVEKNRLSADKVPEESTVIFRDTRIVLTQLGIASAQSVRGSAVSIDGQTDTGPLHNTVQRRCVVR